MCRHYSGFFLVPPSAVGEGERAGHPLPAGGEAPCTPSISGCYATSSGGRVKGKGRDTRSRQGAKPPAPPLSAAATLRAPAVGGKGKGGTPAPGRGRSPLHPLYQRLLR